MGVSRTLGVLVSYEFTGKLRSHSVLLRRYLTVSLNPKSLDRRIGDHHVALSITSTFEAEQPLVVSACKRAKHTCARMTELLFRNSRPVL